jgi:hypothetical protein
VLGLVLLAFPASAASVKVPKTIPFAKASRVRAAIKNECGLQTMIPAAIVQYSSDAELVDGKGNLDLEITQVHAPGGWVFSGPKWLEVTGKLRRGRKVVGTFRAKRFSVDPTAGGVCGMLAKCAQNIGVDVARWLESPSMNAEIGDAK